jgi:hypothetical protein
MRPWVRRAAGAAVVLTLLAPDASGQPAEGTTVDGDVPTDLVGRWLVVEQNRLPGGMVHPFARLWEIRQGPEHLELVLRQVRLPEALSTKLVSAGSANRPWVPADGDLRELAERWYDLPRSATDVQRIDHRLVGPGAHPPDLPHEAETGTGSLVIATEERFSGSQAVRASHAVYTVRERTPARLAGTFVSDSTAETPAPVSITLRGDFQAYRVPLVPPRSRLHRLLGTLLGRDEPS